MVVLNPILQERCVRTLYKRGRGESCPIRIGAAHVSLSQQTGFIRELAICGFFYAPRNGMANLKFSTTLRNNMLDEITSFASTSAKILIYSGTQPAGGGAASGTLLATLTANASQFAASASGGILTLSSITGATAVATGTAAWFRITKSDDTWVMDGDVTVTGGGGDLELDNINVTINGTVGMSGTNTITAPNAA